MMRPPHRARTLLHCLGARAYNSLGLRCLPVSFSVFCCLAASVCICGCRCLQTAPTPTGLRGGDGFIELGQWRVGNVDGDHFSFSHSSGKTAVMFRKDGTVHSGPRTDHSLWSRPGGSVRNVKFSRDVVEFSGAWRLGDYDDNHMSLAHKDGYTAMIWRKDGTRHTGPPSRWGASKDQQSTWRKELVEGVLQSGAGYFRLGQHWIVGEVNSRHMSIGHAGSKKTAAIYSSDGTIHPGPRSDYGLWDAAAGLFFCL